MGNTGQGCRGKKSLKIGSHALCTGLYALCLIYNDEDASPVDKLVQNRQIYLPVSTGVRSSSTELIDDRIHSRKYEISV